MNTLEGATDSSENNPGGNDGVRPGTATCRRRKDQLVRELRAVVDDAQVLLQEATRASSENDAAVPGYLDDRLTAVKDNLQGIKTTLQEKARRTSDATDEYVRENPWRALGFATAASVFVSILVVSAWMPAPNKSGVGRP